MSKSDRGPRLVERPRKKSVDRTTGFGQCVDSGFTSPYLFIRWVLLRYRPYSYVSPDLLTSVSKVEGVRLSETEGLHLLEFRKEPTVERDPSGQRPGLWKG